MASIGSITSQSSIDLLVDRFLNVERAPSNKLETEKTSLSSRVAVLTDLKSELTSLNDRFESFTTAGTENTLASKIAKSSDESLFTVDADATAVAGVYSIKINQLAKNDTAVSKQFSLTGTTLASALSNKTVSFKIGTGSETQTSFSVSFGNSSLDNEDVLNSVAREINSASIDVSATVIKDTPSTIRLTLISKNAGSSNALNLSDVSSPKVFKSMGFINGNGSRSSIKNTDGGFVNPDTDDLNSEFTINGINIVGDSNTVTDVLAGVTVTLRKAQASTDAAESISITNSGEDIVNQINEFIKDFNSSIEFINAKTSINTTTLERGTLAGNFSVRNLLVNMRALVSGKVSSAKIGNPQTLSEIGIRINNNGTLLISDEDKLNSTIESGSEKVTDLFNSESGIAVRGQSLLKNFISVGGTIDDLNKGTKSRITGIESNIKRNSSRLQLRENTLRRTFSDLQRSLSKLNSQSSILQRISGLLGQNTGNTGSIFQQTKF